MKMHIFLPGVSVLCQMAQQSNGNNDTQEGNANVSEHHVDDEGIEEGMKGNADGFSQVRVAAESIIEDVNKGNVHQPPLEGDLMRQIYQSMNQPRPTITNQRQEVLYKVLDNDFLKDFCDKNTLDVTDKVVVEYVDYIRSEISFYSGLLHVSFEALQHNVWEALYKFISKRNILV